MSSPFILTKAMKTSYALIVFRLSFIRLKSFAIRSVSYCIWTQRSLRESYLAKCNVELKLSSGNNKKVNFPKKPDNCEKEPYNLWYKSYVTRSTFWKTCPSSFDQRPSSLNQHSGVWERDERLICQQCSNALRSLNMAFPWLSMKSRSVATSELEGHSELRSWLENSVLVGLDNKPMKADRERISAS